MLQSLLILSPFSYDLLLLSQGQSFSGIHLNYHARYVLGKTLFVIIQIKRTFILMHLLFKICVVIRQGIFFFSNILSTHFWSQKLRCSDIVSCIYLRTLARNGFSSTAQFHANFPKKIYKSFIKTSYFYVILCDKKKTCLNTF